ncbi:hypothetical protein JYU34_018528 [Plutella xylostella]|uniref:Uncharacterized protein n=1 Tax=Plutella xylostella TaxID=51655 RepID=A0ABQ7PXS6_PLUXY|nr:hypothetical protein JYU34_018528 [Plutella xylostella]
MADSDEEPDRNNVIVKWDSDEEPDRSNGVVQEYRPPEVEYEPLIELQICTDWKACTKDHEGKKTCQGLRAAVFDKKPKKTNPTYKLRMGDIKGPCGNTDCVIAQKIRNYIRSTEVYKKATENMKLEIKSKSTRRICGKCICKDERIHRPTCPTRLRNADKGGEGVCSNCGQKFGKTGRTCDQDVNEEKEERCPDY